jgi:hypothetical protein
VAEKLWHSRAQGRSYSSGRPQAGSYITSPSRLLRYQPKRALTLPAAASAATAATAGETTATGAG